MRALAICFLLALGATFAAAETSTNGVVDGYLSQTGATYIWNDTLARFSGDSVSTTDSVLVPAGTRALYVLAQSSTGAESMAVPLVQFRALNRPGQWEGNVKEVPSQYAAGFSATTKVTQTPTLIYAICPDNGQSGTPYPLPGYWARWRIKSSNLRRYSAPSSATLSAQGTITVTVQAWRF